MHNLASFIDHTLLKPEATEQEIKTLCQEARKHEFAAVCVNPMYVQQCASLLEDTPVKVCTVVGFPLGATTSQIKRAEAEEAVQAGAEEIDMVIAIGALKSGNDEYVKRDIASVVQACEKRALVKVIIETALLTEEEKKRACQLAKAAGADYVKTSTGFAGGGATVEDVRLMKEAVGEAMKVKASGGVRTREDAEALISAGAARIGTSSGVALVSPS